MDSLSKRNNLFYLTIKDIACAGIYVYTLMYRDGSVHR
jgi:hypothetical protein